MPFKLSNEEAKTLMLFTTTGILFPPMFTVITALISGYALGMKNVFIDGLSLIFNRDMIKNSLANGLISFLFTGTIILINRKLR